MIDEQTEKNVDRARGSRAAGERAAPMSELIDLTGQRFGRLTVLKQMPPREDGRTRWFCRCDCGGTSVVLSQSLRGNRIKSCGCARHKELAGQTFGKLTALERSDRFLLRRDGSKRFLWKCICTCGEIAYRLPEKLRNDVSCACSRCAARAANAAMVAGAGFAEGTQLTKLRSMKPTAANSSGVRGVCWNKRSKKWRAVLRFKRKDYYLGEYRNFEDAVKARMRAEEEYYAPLLEKYKELSE